MTLPTLGPIGPDPVEQIAVAAALVLTARRRQ
jgi:hypothetical protein